VNKRYGWDGSLYIAVKSWHPNRGNQELTVRVFCILAVVLFTMKLTLVLVLDHFDVSIAC